MLMKTRLWFILTVLAAATLACQSTYKGTPASTPAHGEVLYQDDFSSPNSGWTTWKQEVSEVAYQDGGLRMRINESRYDYWSRPGKRFGDTQIEVDASRVSGPENNDFGIICRYRNGDNFYGFFFSSDGYYGIVRVRDGQYQVLGAGEMKYSEEIQTGNRTNRLRGDCVGSNLTLYVNGKRLAQAQDSTFEFGEVGLLAGTYDAPGVEIQFDNFTVLKP